MSQNVNVNLIPGSYPKEFHVSQYDVGRQLVAKIVDSTGNYSIPSGATVVLVGTKPSGFGFTLTGTVSSGSVVTFTTTATVTAEYGRIPCEIRITNGSTILGTANCMLVVEKSPHPEGTTDGDCEQVVSEITLLLQRITEQADRADQAKEDAEGYASDAAASASAAASSESNAAASEATAVSAKNDAVAAKTAAQASEESAAESAAEAEATLSSYAKVDGEYDSMTVGTAKALLGDVISESTEPYTFRQTGGGLEVGKREVVEQIVGGTVAWNQLCDPKNVTDTSGATFTVVDGVITINGTTTGTSYYPLNSDIKSVANHIYLVIKNQTAQLNGVVIYNDNKGVTVVYYVDSAIQKATGDGKFYIRTDSGVTFNNYKITPQIFDLTAMFGSTIADAIYAMEQATAGTGVAWFKKLFHKSYYSYDAGSLQSVKASAHVTKDADDNVVGNYPLPNVELRGIPKWVNGKLSYDGDILEPSGRLTRKYGIVDLGTLTWYARESGDSSKTRFVAYLSDSIGRSDTTVGITSICDKIMVIESGGTYDATKDGYTIYNKDMYVYLDAYKTSTAAAFKTAMSGVYLVYELATPTTETADPYTSIQICDPNGTEEWIDERTVPIPVGSLTKYTADLVGKLADLPTIPSAPSANGTYTLKATVSGGTVTYSWVNG